MPVGVSGDYYLAFADGYLMKEYMKKNTDISIADESLRKMINECNENSNPILIKFRLK